MGSAVVVGTQGDHVAHLVYSLFGQAYDVMRLELSPAVSHPEAFLTTVLAPAISPQQHLFPDRLIADVAPAHALAVFRIVVPEIDVDVIYGRAIELDGAARRPGQPEAVPVLPKDDPQLLAVVLKLQFQLLTGAASNPMRRVMAFRASLPLLIRVVARYDDSELST